VNQQREPLVCICIPSYNAATTIGETITSILAQSYTNFVLKVVDNASTDGTADVVAGFSDSRIEVHRNATNVGGEGNFNRCIELGCGDYLAIFHADDVYEPEMISTQVAFLEANAGASAVFTDAVTIDERGRETGALVHPQELGTLSDFRQVFRAILRHSNFLICPSAMARTVVYREGVRRWRDELFGTSADLDVWLRMSKLGPVGILADKLMRYRISQSQWSAKVRAQTSRADFFRVTDYYLADPNVREFLSPMDLENLARLERRDLVMRAANAVMGGQSDLARLLIPSPLSRAMIDSAFADRRSFAVFALACVLLFLLAARLDWLARWFVSQVKSWTQR